jgi:hypothetical protein
MTETQKKFLEISKRYETLKEEMKAIKPNLTELMLAMGEGTMFQDPETSLVYKIEKPSGTFISFDPISYVRTKKVGEDRGTLSKTEAEKAGFTLSK